MKKGKLPTIILILIFMAGLCLLLYPTASNYWNSLRHSTAVNHYISDVGAIDEGEYEALLETARQYNQSLLERANQYKLSEHQALAYPDLLDISGDGVMGVIEIPAIGVALPIYHGTSTSVLQKAVGHLEWTSLPIGGVSTHSVLSGHRGLPSSKLFTDLDRLTVGDIFCVRVLNETITYEVDQILIVEPVDTTALEIVDGEDYCTLITCTPYGINTHRILVRGHRIENVAEARFVQVSADAVMIEPLLVAPAMFVGLLLILLIVVALMPRGGNRNGEDIYEEK